MTVPLMTLLNGLELPAVWELATVIVFPASLFYQGQSSPPRVVKIG